MNRKSLRGILVLGALSFQWVGCTQAPPRQNMGIIVPPPSGVGVGSQAPDARFVDSKGNAYWISSVYDDATVIVFIDRGCENPSPELIQAGETLGGRVRIVEICSERCESQTDCVTALQGQSQHLVAFCDGKQVLSGRYGLEDGNGVFVLDSRGVVRKRGTLDDLPVLISSARKVATAAARTRTDLYSGN